MFDFKYAGIEPNQGSISPTFYKQLLCMQIQKAQKKTFKLSRFFALLGSTSVKAACRMLVKLTQGERERNAAAAVKISEMVQ